MIIIRSPFLTQNTQAHIKLILTKFLTSASQHVKHFANVKWRVRRWGPP